MTDTPQRSTDTGHPIAPTLLLVANSDWYLFNFRANLIASAEAARWSPHLICPRGDYIDKLRGRGWPVSEVALDARGFNPLHELRAFAQLCRALKRIKPDVVHLFTLKCVLLGCLAAPFAKRAHFVGAITGMGHLFTSSSWRTRLLKKPVLLGMKAALKLSRARLIFQNEADRDEFVEHGLIAESRTHIIRGSGVDCSRFRPSTASRGENDRPTLLFCGRLISEKGIHEYLQATEALRRSGHVFESRIAGAPYPGNPSSLSDADAERLRNDGSHSYLGHHDDMPGLLAETDIVVLPTYREGTPKALLEAAACGCIIVTTDIPGCAGIVEPGVNGYLVPPKTTDPLVEALEKLLAIDHNERQAMRLASRRIAESRFSDIQVNEKTRAIYEFEGR